MEKDNLQTVIDRFVQAKKVTTDQGIAWVMVQQSLKMDDHDYYRSLPKGELSGCESTDNG